MIRRTTLVPTVLVLLACPTAPTTAPDEPRANAGAAKADQPASRREFAPDGSRRFADWADAVAAGAVDETSLGACTTYASWACIADPQYCAQLVAGCEARVVTDPAANIGVYELAFELRDGVVVLPPLRLPRGAPQTGLAVTIAPPYLLLEQPFDLSGSNPYERPAACEPPDVPIQLCRRVLDLQTLAPLAEWGCGGDDTLAWSPASCPDGAKESSCRAAELAPYVLLAAQSGEPCEDMQDCLVILDRAARSVLRDCSDDGGPNAIEIPPARPQ